MRRIALYTVMFSLAAAGQAFAHAHLEASEPKAGAVIAHAPPQLRLRFNEVIRLPASGVQLTYPDGRQRLLKPLAQDPKDVLTVLAPVPAPMPPGRYVVAWRALSPDAHHTRGSFDFTLAR